jgi:adenylate kinase family enzyme
LVGRRIVVWGVTGSGKTTLARRLGEMLGLGVIELDAIRHARGWDSVEDAEMRMLLEQRMRELGDGWVLDGSYSMVHDVYLPHADTLIRVGLPWRVSFWRLFRRTVTRAWTREPLYNPEGPTESWRMTFFSRRSILWWSISRHRGTIERQRGRIAALEPHVTVHELRSPREVDAFLRAVGEDVTAATRNA